jgi:opacity protein-like surface antigen
MVAIRRHAFHAFLISICGVSIASAQVPNRLFTRFEIGGNFIRSEPKEGFSQNIGHGWGGGGTLKYNLDGSGLLGLRFDVSGVAYGREKVRIPLSRVLLEMTTTNSIATFTLGPELARPSGRIRPYLNAGYGRLLFRTTSTIADYDSADESVSTTNHKDGTGAWVYGGGLRFSLGPAASPLSLDLGLRYHRGGSASYLREGSIQDYPEGSFTLTPLSSRTPFMVYSIGVKYRIPFDSNKICSRFLC